MATVKRTSNDQTFQTVSPTAVITFSGPTANTANVVVDGTANITTVNVSSSMTGSGIGVENFVYQSTDYNFTSGSPATLGSLQFTALANCAYQFNAYIVLVPTGFTTYAPAVSFSAGNCNYTTEIQITSTASPNVATKTTSNNVTTTYNSTGTDARTLCVTGNFKHTANTTVAMTFQTSAANVTVKTGSYLSYTRIN